MSNIVKKRFFDLTITLLSSVLWVPVIFVFALLNLTTEGFPVFYSSFRRVSISDIRKIFKFRTMVKDADKKYNRDTVPVTDVRFLNTPITSPLYTRIGRIIEKYALTELPQFFHVIQGHMSVVGNRPLPENVVQSLSVEYPGSINRFCTPAGMTGPIQLVGRTKIIDRDRLVLEITYCEVVREAYTWRLDFLILLYTVLISLKLHEPLSVQQTHEFIVRHTGCEFKFPESMCRRKDNSEERVVWSEEQREWALNSRLRQDAT